MSPNSLRPATAVLAILAAGCAAPPPMTERPEPRPLGRNLVMPPELAAAAAARAVDPDAGFAARETTMQSGRLTLARALAQSLLGSPDLAAYGFDIRSAEARTLQAGYRPNPEANIYLEDFGGNRDRGGFRGYQGTLSLSQVVELGGKRAQRLRLARLDESLSAWDYEARRLDVLTNTLRAFAEVLAAQRKVGLAGETLATEQRFFRAVAERVHAGQVSPLEQDRAQVALSNGRIALAASTRDLAAARSRLAVQWGGREAAFDSADGDLEQVSPPPPLPALLAQATENPDVARWQAEVQQREARLAVERSKNVPDVTLDGGVRRYGDGGTAFVGGVTVAIPVFGLNRGNEMDAQAQLDRGRVQAHAAEVRAASDLRQAFERLSRAYDEVGLLRREVLPAAQSAYDGADLGYRGGKFSLLDVLDAQRSLTDARVRLVDALAAYQGAAADVERLTGRSLQDSALEFGAPRDSRPGER